MGITPLRALPHLILVGWLGDGMLATSGISLGQAHVLPAVTEPGSRRRTQALAEAEVRLAELEHRKRKLEEAERASQERLAAASRDAAAKVGPASVPATVPQHLAQCRALLQLQAW